MNESCIKKNIGFLGCGNMASAIISGILDANISSPENIFIYDIDAEKSNKFSKSANVVSNPAELAEKSDILFICVKPQVIGDALSGITRTEGVVFVSIAAGISTAYLASILGDNTKIIRVMPNTPLLIKEGATAICCNKNVDPSELLCVKGIFSALGVVEEIPETLMNEVICANGSMPAIVYSFIASAIKSAVSQGIEETVAKNLICSTFVGSAKMLACSPLSPEELIKIVCSPGGTTERAVAQLKNADTDSIIHNAMVACTKRAYELEK